MANLIPSPVITCGYKDGDPSQVRKAAPGYGCRVDITNSLWGFCPTTIVAASNCGLAGACIDRYSCSDGCGRLEKSSITTFSCEPSNFCSTMKLINGPDQSYDYIACGGVATTETLFASPTVVSQLSTVTPTSTPTSSISTNTLVTSDTSWISTSTKATESSLRGSTSVNTSSFEPKPNNTGAIIGGVLGGISLVCITVLVAIFLRRKRHANKDDGSSTALVNSPENVFETKNTIQSNWTRVSEPLELDSRNIDAIELSSRNISNAAELS